MLPQVNATLTLVNDASAAAGGRDDWDQPGVEQPGAGAVKWQGDEPAYYRESVQRTYGPEANVVKTRTLWVSAAASRVIDVDTDDVLTFTDPAGVAQTARVLTVARHELDSIPPELQTCRLDLEPA